MRKNRTNISFIFNLTKYFRIKTNEARKTKLSTKISLRICLNNKEFFKTSLVTEPPLFLCGKGCLGIGLSRNSQRGVQPSETLKKRVWSFGAD